MARINKQEVCVHPIYTGIYQQHKGYDNEVDYYTAKILSNSDYYPFGVQMSERSYNSTGRRYGFNGKENDEEMETMDFGARLLDGDLGVWLAVDAKAGKYPMESPYIFAGNSPLIMVDIDGDEKIVIAASDHHGNTWKFLNAAMGQLRQYKKSNETKTLLLLNNNYYCKRTLGLLKFFGEIVGVKIVSVATASEMVDYINGATVNAHGYKRSKDPITSIDVFAHGTPSKIESDYATEGNTVLDKSLAKAIKPESFSADAVITSYACRTGASVDLPAKWNPFANNSNIDEQIKLNGSDNSLAQQLADDLGIKVDAFMARTDYNSIHGGFLFRNIIGEKDFGAIENYEGKGGVLYTMGAPFHPTGSTATSAVNPSMFRFTKGNKPTPINKNPQ